MDVFLESYSKKCPVLSPDPPPNMLSLHDRQSSVSPAQRGDGGTMDQGFGASIDNMRNAIFLDAMFTSIGRYLREK